MDKTNLHCEWMKWTNKYNGKDNLNWFRRSTEEVLFKMMLILLSGEVQYHYSAVWKFNKKDYLQSHENGWKTQFPLKTTQWF